MFYEALGRLIGQSGVVLAGVSGGAESGLDKRDQREVRQIGVLLRRTQGVWNEVFSTLEAEIGVLEAGLAEANETLVGAGRSPIETVGGQAPIARYRDLEVAVDASLEVFLAHCDEDWARGGRKALRSRLVQASEIQGRLTDMMLAIR